MKPKKLKWHGGAGFWLSENTPWTYTICENLDSNGKRIGYCVNYSTLPYPQDISDTNFKSVVSAKNAAQEHFDGLVGECFE